MISEERRKLADHLRELVAETLSELDLGDELLSDLERIYLPLAARLADAAENRNSPLIVGVNGAQGTGKTTLCVLLQTVLEEGFGLRVAGFSIDDLYRTRAEREELARTVHPLFITRGVPGTHDVDMGLRLFDALSSPGTVRLPVFDKAADDRAPAEEWRSVEAPVDLILFEGWCVGAVPQREQELAEPVNELEAREDPEGRWRRYVNERLAGEYARLFGRLDRLVLLKVPDFDCVFEWRRLQEQKLAASQESVEKNRIMDETALRRFIMHYERLTRHALAEMPTRADLVLELDAEHRMIAMEEGKK